MIERKRSSERSRRSSSAENQEQMVVDKDTEPASKFSKDN